jgi:hypothetical protein
MLQKRFSLLSMLFVVLALQVLTLALFAQQSRTLVVAGHAGELAVVEMGGHSYVEVESLARLANSSLSFRGNQIVLTLSPPNAGLPATGARGFTKEFLKAGIEQMSVIREWRSTLISAIQRGYPITDEWMKSFSDQAQQNLRLVSVAVSSESDKNAFQLLTNEFNNMKQLSDRFVAANKSSTYIRSDAVENDPLDRKILNCGHSLAAMAASGQFVDDGSCQ